MGLWKKVEKLKGGVSRGPEVQRKSSDVSGRGIFFRIFGEDGKGGGRRGSEEGRGRGRAVRKTGFMKQSQNARPQM